MQAPFLVENPEEKKIQVIWEKYLSLNKDTLFVNYLTYET